MWDRAGKLLFLNVAALTLFEVQDSAPWCGTSTQQFLQRYTWCDEQQRSFSFPLWLLSLTTLKQEAVPLPYEQTLVLTHPSDHQICLELRCSLVFDGLQPTGVLASFQVMTSRYQKALHIQRVYEALMTLNDAIARIPEQFLAGHSEDPCLLSLPVRFVDQQLVDVIRQVLACWCVNLVAFRAPLPLVAHVAGSGFSAEREHLFREHGWRFRFADFFDETVLARLQANQEVILSPGCFHIPTGYPEEFGNANLLVFPLFREQHLAGMIVIHKHQWEGGYTQEEIDLVREVNEHIRLFIECLGSLQTSLEKQARELVLSEVTRLCYDFLRLASHELRTPLTGIKGNLQLAQRRLERLRSEISQQAERTSAQLERARRSLESAEQSVRLQERMVQDMIDDARIQAGQLDLTLAPCDLLVLVKQVVVKQQKSEPGRAIKLEILTPNSTISILADAGRITQVLTIYLTTALASSPVEQPVTVQVQEEVQMARFSVHDKGAGIPLEEQIRLWDRFYRGKGSSVQQELDLSGGLRFYLYRMLLEHHHGTVGVESTPGQGATSWLTLPMVKPTSVSTT
ncbi:sensor histidine kinase [Ktedonospora formicarum]|uniref:histidine kinase n=1 Tax=Ktedonospora formicarum TaxID=2778364 RepID=A0A8J3I851_9CHLR|nr:HAMP domain-containing sensor histidine kinase [Ktedonospora formicarum]GHO47134.1 hypothetical protein KSX_52970 [Ktedonospora formicarum]